MMIIHVLFRRFFWYALLELAGWEFLLSLMDNYERARQDALRRLHGERHDDSA